MLAPLGEKETSPSSEDRSKVSKRKALLPATYVCMFRKLQENYPADTYTDGSAKEAGGGGIYIEWPNGLSQRMSTNRQILVKLQS